MVIPECLEQRPKLSELLEKHREEIAELKEDECGREYDDDILLRYVLSDPQKLDVQIKKIRKATLFRIQNEEWMTEARNLGTNPPFHDEVKDLFISDLHGFAKDGTIINIARAGLITKYVKTKQINNLSTKFLEWTLYIKEAIFWGNIERSRKYDRLMKTVLILDMRGLQLFVDLKIVKPFTKSSEISNSLHPQFIDVQIYVNVPRHFSGLYHFIKPFLPQKFVQKSTVCGRGRSILSTPYGQRNFSPEMIPPDLGGTCESCEGSCVREFQPSKIATLRQN
eukprot:Plantae.Rhodophyta-Purpureofilum_apyrenoidigerum.ctg13311.p1 GENE.Plantae.Rhodophyta-Purpureofilum_apyrenoidigerum.ctg13311~~Plantae.Rhodophyta-Purpureofilum_apyrenoidigerum.ctg13311.p1  ORF type:complete len:281 (-),score=51.08 Plantae.Rhodophyta-Purpureofilum_apyrenoidigerum.ctg13311:147-989(-)